MSSTFDWETEAAGLWRTRSGVMGITGHLSRVYRRYAIVDEAMLRTAGERLSASHAAGGA